MSIRTMAEGGINNYSNNAVRIRLAIQMKRQDIKQLLSRRPFETRQILRHIFTPEELTVIANECDNHGSVGQANMIIEKVLIKSDAEVETFLETMEGFEQEPEIYRLIVGNLQMGDSMRKVLGTHIRRTYTERKCNLVQSLPGEEFILDLNKHQYIMPLVLQTERLKTNLKTLDLLPQSKVKFEYECVNFENLEDIASSLCHSQKALVLVRGIAGTGKSISTQRLVCLWITEDNCLKDYDIVLVILVRSINVMDSIIDIVGEKGLGLVNDDLKEILELLLESESSQVLVVVDGVDEVDIPESSELFQFIIGHKYPNVKKVITARPEAEIITTLKDSIECHPDYRVEIQGTNKQGVYKYLKAVMSTGDRDIKPEEIDDIIERCERDMVDFNLLLVPLYLTLTGFLFTDHLAQESYFADFKVPRTVTQFFNAFMHILLRVWLQRLGQSNLAEMLKFTNNPIASTSNLANDIKRKLIFFGQISYDFLLVQKYTFKQEDLDRYLIDQEDIRASGIFSVSQKGNSKECFFKHKSMQEYMAAVYLSHVQFREHTFTNLVEQISQPRRLQARFSKLSQVLRFLFGLKPKFVIEILNKLQDPCIGCYYEGGVILDDEAVLFLEADDPDLIKTFTDFLCSCELVLSVWTMYTDVQLPQIFSLCQALSKVQRISLLDKWYLLNIYRDNNDLIMVNSGRESAKDKVHIQCIDDVFYFLVQDMNFSNIRKLEINHMHAGDIDLLQMTFPRVQAITVKHYATGLADNGDVRNLLRHYGESGSESPATDGLFLNPSLTHVVIFSSYDGVTKFRVKTIIHQSELESLRLQCVDILTEMSDTMMSNVCWNKLTELEINPIHSKDILRLFGIFQHTPKINSITLTSYKWHFSEEMNILLLQSLTQSPLKDIHCLRLFGLLTSAAVAKLLDNLQQLQSLHTLGLSHAHVVNEDYKHSKQQGILAKIVRCSSITNMHLGYEPNKCDKNKENALAACRVLTRDMNSPSDFLENDRETIHSMLEYLALCVYDYDNFELTTFDNTKEKSDLVK